MLDERAGEIEALYRRKRRAFHLALGAVTGSWDSAHDAVQEGFARAYARRDQFSGTSLEAWVWRIALNAAVDVQRRLRGPLARTIEPDPMPPAAERDPDLVRALRSLSPQRRLVVFLRYYGDLSYAEIAEALGISEGTVGATLAQAHAALAAQLDPKEVTT